MIRELLLALLLPCGAIDSAEPIPDPRPLAGENASISYYDPLAGRSIAVSVVRRDAESLTIELPVIDTPCILTMEER